MCAIKNTYKDLKCYQDMSDIHKNSFDNIVNAYADLLNRGCPIGSVLYTSHDFNKHCNNIYSIISNIILRNASKLDSKELYLLNLSVLFHDISMSVDTHWKRETHSKQSGEFIRSELDNTSSTLSKEKAHDNLTINYCNTISNIITAHSDIKDGSVGSETNGIFNPELTFNDASQVNSKLLAAILRLADELDVTSDRIGEERFSEQLNESNESEKISKSHWERLHYFSHMDFAKNDATTLIVYCDDNYLNRYLDNASNIKEEMLKTINKINAELSVLNKEIFNRPECQKVNFHCNKVIYHSNIKEFSMSSNPIENFQYSENVFDAKKFLKKREQESKGYPKMISEKNSVFLKKEIYERRLMSGGHFIVNEKYCSRDWINVGELIETESISKVIVKSFTEHCKANIEYTDSIIVGLDINGSIIASNVAMNLHLPFQYIIPAKSKLKHSGHDFQKELPDDKKVIIITDVISTFSTVQSAIKNHKIKDILAIYCILYRNADDKITIDEEIMKKCFCLNKDFKIELIDSTQCENKGEKTCLAKN